MSNFRSFAGGICNTAAGTRGSFDRPVRGFLRIFTRIRSRAHRDRMHFLHKVLHSLAAAKWGSSKIPQTIVRRLFRLSAPCVRTAKALRRSRERSKCRARERGSVATTSIPPFDVLLRASNRGPPEAGQQFQRNGQKITIAYQSPISAAGPGCSRLRIEQSRLVAHFAWPPGLPAEQSQNTVVF